MYQVLIALIAMLFFINNITAINNSVYKTNYSTIQFYKYSAILPIISDSSGNNWVYFTLDIHNKKTVIDIFGGIIEKKDKNILSAGIRELHEESLDIFQNEINSINLFNNISEVDYKTFRTKMFVVYLKDMNNKIKNNCDYFSKKYYQRRYLKPKNYNRLSLAQKETVGIRRVRLEELLKYIENPRKYPDGLTTYYSNSKKCNITSKEKFRFEAGLLLSFASLRKSLNKISGL